MNGTAIRIATRASQLAKWQARFVAESLRRVGGLEVELVEVTTQGDRDRVRSLASLGGIGVFTREVQRAVLDGRADLAVHSLKDLPTEPVEGLVLAAVPERGPVRDALVLPQRPGNCTGSPSLSPEHTDSPDANQTTRSVLDAEQPAGAGRAHPTAPPRTAQELLDQLPEAARVGSGSLRRQAQLLHLRPDLQVVDIRGNVETRLRKLDDGQCDVLVLAEAGLRRLGLERRISAVLGPPLLFPAVGQGALGIECRVDDERCRELLEKINHPATFRRVVAERALLAELRAGCHAPVGVWSEVADGRLTLEAVVLSRDGRERLTAKDQAPVDQAEQVGRRLAQTLLSRGAARLVSEQ